MTNLNQLVSNFAAAQLLAIRLSEAAEVPAKCPGYGCFATLGPDSGIIDGTRYCADCCVNEAEMAGREERLQDAELFDRGGGDL